MSKLFIPKDSWFADWLKAHEHIEPPLSFKLLSAMSIFGACVGGRVFYEHDGVRQLFPMLNLLLIGPSGIGKSYSIDLGMELARSLPPEVRPQLIHGSTPEKMHEDIFKNPHTILVASELANFFNKQKYMEGMIPYVTELLDYRPVERRTKFEGTIRIDLPAVTVIGGSTVEWLQNQLPDSAGAGGFLARFFIIKEEFKGHKDGLPLFSSSGFRESQRALREGCIVRFQELVRSYSGEFTFSDFDAAERYSFWYANHKPETGLLSPFSARAGEFVLRLSIIMAMSRGHVGIEETDLESAFTIYDLMIDKLQGIVVSFTPQGRLLDRLLQSLSQGPRTLVELRRAMRNFCGSKETDALIQSLLESSDIYRNTEGRFSRSYYVKGSS